MQILQSVIVKQVLTEKCKAKMLKNFLVSKQQYEKEIEQLRFELKKLERAKKFPPTSLSGHFDKEIETRLDKIKLTDLQIEQLNVLPLGTELTDQKIQAVKEVHVGDKWDDSTQEKTIVVKDGIIIEIR